MTSTSSRRILSAWVLASACALVACKSKESGQPPATETKKSEGSADQTEKPAPALIASGIAAPAGVKFKKSPQSWGSLELPDGEGWTSSGTEVEGKDGTVIMIQTQAGVPAAALDDYLASYNKVQIRDAPKYQKAAETKGSVGGQPAARVEAGFDNGTKFVTRDYLIFANGRVVMVGARTPAANAASLAPLVDYVVSTARVN